MPGGGWLLFPAEALAAPISVRLRIAWGGGPERVWNGHIRIDNGTCAELVPLGIEADEPGSIWTDGQQIHVRQPSPRAFDGVDVLITAEPEARLSVELAHDASREPQTTEVTLAEVLTKSHSAALDDAGNRLNIARAPGDRLRIQFEREHLVFAPGESFTFEVQPNHLETATTGLRLQAQILSSPAGQRVWAEEFATGDEGTATTVTIKLPEVEGVYDLSITAVQPSLIRKRLGLQTPVVARKLQLVVLDSAAPAASAEALTARVVEINPVHPGWWERVANLPIPGYRKGPLGNGDAAPWEHPTLGPLVQLGPGGTAPNMSWEAYPLPITHPGQVHVLEIEYPSNVPQAMGISLMEPNAAGTVSPIGLDSGVYVSDEEAENAPKLLKHRVFFWPRTKAPVLLITNRRPGSRAVYGKIAVLSVPTSQFSKLALGRGEPISALPPAFADDRRPERLWAGYLDRPLVAENFSAPESLDGASRRSLDDWTTFYQGGQRLVKYLKHVGFNGLMLSVYADGSTIYPSRLVESTPRYDTGAFFGSGQDPLRKDALELMFRLFDREHLVLVPALQFAAPLPALEALRRAGGSEAIGLEWTGPDGKPYLASNPARQGLAPYYNLLDPRVQRAMLDVAGEVANRYAEHEAFGGLALQLGPEGYAQLPGDEWGYDERTIAAFERDTRVRIPATGADRQAARVAYLKGPGREAWLTWRAMGVARFHRQLEQVIAKSHPGAKLYLAGSTLLEDRQTQYRLRPTLPRRTRLEDALKELGIDVRNYGPEGNTVLLRPQVLRPATGPLSPHLSDAEVYLAPEMDRLFAGAAGSLFYHEPQKARLTSFDAKSPFGAANTYTWLVAEMSPSGDRNRRRFVHSLATSDVEQMFDGGWLLPLGQESALTRLISVYRQLPAGPFETVAGEYQPLTIRTLSRDRQTYLYVVNDSPWPTSATMQLDVPPDCRLEALGDGRGAGPLNRAAGQTSWKVTLEPYDLVAVRLTSAGARVRMPVAAVSEQVRQSMHRRIEDLVARVAALGNPTPLAALQNGSFETPQEGESIAHWTVSLPAGGAAGLDAHAARGGNHSLRLVSDGKPTRITSAPFDPPQTGRLTVEVWLRTNGTDKPPKLRIGVEGQGRDGAFDPYGVIEKVGASAPSAGDWVSYSFPIDNLPSEGLSNLRVHFELQSAGEVWIDDVQVFDLAFSPAERLELSKMISLASSHLERNHYSDCALVLEGYWPQFLVANVPLSSTNVPLAERPRGTRTPTSPPKKQVFLENVQKLLPRLQR